jgi:hypothetical protein
MGNTQRFWEPNHGSSTRLAGQHRSWSDDYEEEDGDETELPDEFVDEDE